MGKYQQFHHYFYDKVAGVRSATADAPPSSFSPCCADGSFCQFQYVTIDEVVAVVRALPDKSCALDPLPTAQLEAVIDVIAPFLTDLFNRSMTTGTVPGALKAAYITPLVKKSDMDSEDVRLYRPMSKLSVVSKLLERLVTRQLLEYLNKFDLLPQLQSAYRAGHSTETAVLKVLSDILLAVDAGNLSALVLLDLSAALTWWTPQHLDSTAKNLIWAVRDGATV